MDKMLTLLFLIILLLILVAPKFVEDAKIAVIFAVICIGVAVIKILFSGNSKNQNTNSNDDNEPKN